MSSFLPPNLNDWLQQNSLQVGSPFNFQDGSCLPMMPREERPDDSQPVAFLHADSNGVSVIHSPEPGQPDEKWDEAFAEWNRISIRNARPGHDMPTEYWVG